MITIGKLVQSIGRVLDPDLELIYSKLMRKTLEANSFIAS